jgi:hypothetical protein
MSPSNPQYSEAISKASLPLIGFSESHFRVKFRKPTPSRQCCVNSPARCHVVANRLNPMVGQSSERQDSNSGAHTFFLDFSEFNDVMRQVVSGVLIDDERWRQW